MKAIRTEPPQSDPMFYPKVLAENKKLKKKLALRKKNMLKLLKKDDVHTSYEIQLIRKEEQDVHKRI